MFGQEVSDIWTEKAGKWQREVERGGHTFNYSYRSASAGSTLAADHDGYSVAMNDTPIATHATSRPSIGRGAKGT